MRKPPKIISILVMISFLTYPVRLHATDILPQGGVVTAGSATLDYSQAGTLNINVAANQNIANWQSYSVGAENAVNYNRDSSFTFLNRVVGSDPSGIFGAINAPNGKIFLINQNGILFAPGSSVNVAGLTASTLDIRDADFLAGRFTFFGKGGSVVSQGYISAPGGFVALLGSTVENTGVIEANLGKVILASGEKMTLGLDPQDLISVVIDEATTQNLENKDAAVHNIGKIKADGGKVILTAKTLDGVFKQAANNEGVIEAKSLVSKKGEVYLLGNMENDLVANTGTIDVSASDMGVDGGFVELSGHDVDFVNGTIDNRSALGKTGEVLLDPWDFTINDSEAHTLEYHTYGNWTIEALNDVNFSISDDLLNLQYFGNGEYFKILAGRNINFNDDSVTTQGADIILNADKDFWYQAGSHYPKQWVNTADGAGSINLGSGTLKSNGGDIELKAGEDINLGSGSIRSSGGKVTLVADASFGYTGHEATDEGYNQWHNGYWENLPDVKVWHDGYWYWHNGHQYWHNGSWEWVDGGKLWHDGYNEWISLPVLGALGKTNTSDGIGDIDLGNGSGIITSGGAADLSAVNIYATKDILTSGGTLTLNATKDIEVKGNLDAGAAQASLTAGDDISVKDHGRIAAGDLTMSSTDDTTIEDHALIDVVDRLDMAVGDDFKMTDSGAIKSGSAYITTGDTYLYNDADIDIRGIFNITAQDMIMEDSSDIDANIVNILTSRDFLMYDSSDLGDDRDNFSTYINAGRDVRISDNSIYTDFATVYAGDDISLGKIFATFQIDLDAGDDILDHNGSDINLTTDDLYMTAGGTIGEHDASIETDVNDIEAVANNGDVWLIEKDGVNLRNIQALGSTVNIVTGGNTNTYNVYAQGSGLWDPAIVNLTVNHGELNVLGVGIMASHSGEGSALVNLIADGDINAYAGILTETGSGRCALSKIDIDSRWDDINIYGTDIQALVYGYGHAEVNLNADDDINVNGKSYVAAISNEGDATALVKMHADDDININNSSVVAEMSNYGHAEVNLDADDDVTISGSRVMAQSGESLNTALVDIKADDDININHSTVEALMTGNGNATLKLAAGDDISLFSSNLTAQVFGRGHAEVKLEAGSKCSWWNKGDIALIRSDILAKVGEGLESALVILDATGMINLTCSTVEAINNFCGRASVYFNAGDDINLFASKVTARTGFGDAVVDLDAKNDIKLTFSKVLAETILGAAKVALDAGDDIDLFFSNLTAKVFGKGHAEVILNAGSECGWFNKGNITLINSDILAKVGSGLNSALVALNATGEINASFSSVEAVNNNFGPASVYFNAGEDINLFLSSITARTTFGKAVVDLDAEDINLTFSKVLAKAICGSAKVVLDAKDDISLFFSNLTAKVRGNKGYAEVTLDAGSNHNQHGDITISNSKVMAKVNGVGHAEVNLKATDDIDIKHSSKILAKTGSGGFITDISTALITLIAGDDINLDVSSKIKAISHNWTPAAVLALAGGDINAYGKISAISKYGLAGVALLALDNIYAGNVLARGNSDPDAIGMLENLVNCFWMPIRIDRQFAYSSGILLGSLTGDITLGLIRADAVIAAALGGSIWDATNVEEAIVGDVHANYLGMLARYDIGTALNPINTFVDILSAYSWDTGDIYINNTGKLLQLGLYLPISGLIKLPPAEITPPQDSFFVFETPESEWAQIGAIGASVAANNGIIHVVSDGDIVVNSVISPRGGVFMETTNGSIYAGRGWCPVVSQSDLDDIFGTRESGILPFVKSLVQYALMDMSDTAWSSVAGVDYFSPAMFALMPLTGTNDLPLGPNVIAGGYSYFSAPQGSIGVGFQDDPLALFDNPLKVDIQVLNENLGGNNSALPGGGTSVAGLTLKMGGGQGTYNDGFNGSLPVSGVIEGLVRPGTTLNRVNPSPALDLVDVTTGYVFYNDTNTAYGKDCPGCTITLDGSSVTEQGLKQIYPPTPFDLGLVIGQLSIDPRIRNIYHPSFRTVTFDRQTPTGTYFYHPLVLSDSSAFDEIALNAGAYDFIDGNLGLKGDNSFSPYYQNDSGNKKKKGKS